MHLDEAGIDPNRSQRRKSRACYSLGILCLRRAQFFNLTIKGIDFFCPKSLFQSIELLIKRTS